MIKNISSVSGFIGLVMFCFTFFFLNIFSALGQEMPKMNMDTSANMQNQMMLPMSFFTHMGIPLNVGSYALRLAALAVAKDGKINSEFNFQFETGLSKTVGLFLGGEGLFNDPQLETMFQFLVLKSKNGMSGFSPIVEFEFHLAKDAERTVYTIVGFASTISNSHIAINQVIHYSPLEDLAEGSASLVVKASKKIFPVTEISGVIQTGSRPIFNFLAGIKFKLTNNFLLGVAYQLPITTNRNYSSQYVFQPNLILQK